MTTPVYVSSSGSNTSPYETWAKAATSFATGLAQASTAGDTIYMDATDTYTQASTYNPDFSAGTEALPIKLISSTYNTTTYTRGATLNCTGSVSNLIIAGAVSMYGMDLTSTGAKVYFCDDPLDTQYYSDCVMIAGDAAGDIIFLSSGTNSLVELVNCVLTCDGLQSNQGQYTRVLLTGCDIQSHGVSTELVEVINDRMEISFDSCDLTDWTTLVASIGYLTTIVFRQCQLRSAGYTFNTGTMEFGSTILLERSTIETNKAGPALGLQRYEDFYGTVSAADTEDSIYRTGGASDGEGTGYSYKMIADENNTLEFYHALKTPWCVGWPQDMIGGVEVTLTFHLAGSWIPDDDEFWIELITPDATATSTTLADYRSSQAGSDINTPGDPVDPLATPSPVVDDTVGTGWIGSGVANTRMVQCTFTPDTTGPLKYRACLASPDAAIANRTIYFCPKYTVT